MILVVRYSVVPFVLGFVHRDWVFYERFRSMISVHINSTEIEMSSGIIHRCNS